MSDIRKQVEERVAAEAAAMGLSDGPQNEPLIDGKFIRECLFANEQGDGQLYAALFRDRYVYCANSEEWYEWTGTHWERDVLGHSLTAVDQVCRHYLDEHYRVGKERTDRIASGDDPKTADLVRLASLHDDLLRRVIQLRGVRRRRNCLEFAATIASPLAITGEEFDCRPWLFPCANGVVDLQTGLLQPGRPGDYLTKHSDVPFLGIDTPAPIWERVLLEILSGNVGLVSYVRRLLGYSMTGFVTEKVFPVLYGRTGWNGRSLIMETVRRVMGSFAGSIPSEMLLSQKFGKSSSGPSPDIMGLKGIRLAIASEVDENQRFSAARIKWLTGKDELVGRNPHDTHQTRFLPTHKLFLMTNTQPSAPAADSAFWYRVALIPFDISFVNRDPQQDYERRADPNLDAKLQTELPGILAWLVRGCLEWQRDGLKPPREITDATEKYRRNEDLLADFIDECCYREAMVKTTATALYGRFVTWYHDNVGKSEPSGTWFGKQMGARFEKWKSEGRVVYLGIGLVDGELEGVS